MAGAGNYGVTMRELCQLMEEKGEDGVQRLLQLDGVQGLCMKLRTHPTQGLTETNMDVERRRKIFGINKLPPQESKTFLRLVWEAMQDTTLVMLLVAAALSLGLSFYEQHEEQDGTDDNSNTGWIEGLAILLSVVVVVLVTAINDHKKERQFRGLKNRIEEEHKCAVIRQNQISLIQTWEIVVGDVCPIRYGDVVPADGVVIHSNELRLDESSLTGESDHVRKSVDTDPMVLSGTCVMEGSGNILVTAVGINSQAGIIVRLLAQARSPLAPQKHTTDVQNDIENAAIAEPVAEVSSNQKSILQSKLTKLAVQIGYIGSAVALLTIIILVVQFCVAKFVINPGPWQSSYVRDLTQFFIVGVTVLVVAVPEGLPLAITLSLAYSVKRMTKDNNLVRHLGACETMGNATCICSDKTGTLTTNQMTVAASYVCARQYTATPTFSEIPAPVGSLLVQAIAVNTAYTSTVAASDEADHIYKQVGNRTECALLAFVQAMGQDYRIVRNEYPEDKFQWVYTFNSSRKSMSTVVTRPGGGYRLFCKGASEVVLDKCTYAYQQDGDIETFTKSGQESIERDVIAKMASDGLRTITIAFRDFAPDPTRINETLIESDPDWAQEDSVVANLTCLAVVGIEDPVRAEVPEAIRQCRRAGITVRMVTGDNIDTGMTIARKCGILGPGENSLVLEGREFNRRIRDANGKVQQSLLDEVWPRLRVLARSTPTDKYNLVTGIMNSKLGASREVVAVTGDGTNDGPALKKADVGLAMGLTGTDVAKEASDIILTDDNFMSIVKAVQWGRNVYDNITKFIQFQLTVTLVAVVVTFVGACSIQQSTLKAVQMLWVNLIMDTLASLALATELPTPDLLLRKPYRTTQPLVSRTMAKNILGQAAYQLTVIFVLLFLGDRLLDIESGVRSSNPTQHFTVLFNAFVLMTLCNEINSRKIHEERNVFSGMTNNAIFCSIWLSTSLAHVIIVQFGGKAFFTEALDLDQWLWCVFFGIGALLWSQAVLCIPTKKEQRKKKKKKKQDEGESSEQNSLDDTRIGKILWVRSVTRLEKQISAVNAFREGLDGRYTGGNTTKVFPVR